MSPLDRQTPDGAVTALLPEDRTLLITTVLAGLALSLWCVWADPIVNNDGVHYFQAAQAFLTAKWKAGLAIHNWPFYPALIALVSKISGLGVETSAHVLNALLYAILALGFLAAVRQLGGDRRTLWIACTFVLLFPSLNKYRAYVIRDTGFLAFYLWSLAFLFRFWRSRRGGLLVGWGLTTFVAMLFRVEAVAFLIGIPLLLAYLISARRGVRRAILAGALVVSMAMFLTLVVWVYRHAVLEAQGDAPLSLIKMVRGAWQAYGESFVRKLEILQRYVLDEAQQRYTRVAYAGALLTLLVYELMRRTSVIYAVLAVYGARRGVFPLGQARTLWLGLLGLQLLVLAGSTAVTGIIVDRYLMGLVLTGMLVVPFALSVLYTDWRTRRTPDLSGSLIFPGLVFVCLALGVRGLSGFSDKVYLRQAGQWLHTHATENARLLSNNPVLAYYSGLKIRRKDTLVDWQEMQVSIRKDIWRGYQYLAIQVDSDQDERVQWIARGLERQPVAKFANRKGDAVVIFRIGDAS